MPLFTKRGEEPLSLIQRHTSDIDKKTREITNIEYGLITKAKRIEELAVPAEEGDAEALAEIDRLYDEIESDKKILPRKRIALRHVEQLLATEKNKTWAREDKHLRAAMVTELNKRQALAKDAERTAREFVKTIAAIDALNRKAMPAWRATWGDPSEALIGADQSYDPPQRSPIEGVTGWGLGPPKPQGLAEFTRQMLGHLCAEYQVRIPAPAYRATRDEDFPGLAKSYEMIGKHVRAMLSAETPVPSVEPVSAAEPTIPTVAAPQPAQAKTFTDDEIAEMNRLGNPLDWPLSGREWEKLNDQGRKSKPELARHIDFDPHSGGSLDPNEI
jgi:hypothetical protein